MILKCILCECYFVLEGGSEKNKEGRCSASTTSLAINETNGALSNIEIDLHDNGLSDGEWQWPVPSVRPKNILKAKEQMKCFSYQVHLLSPRDQMEINAEMVENYRPSTEEIPDSVMISSKCSSSLHTPNALCAAATFEKTDELLRNVGPG